MKNMKKLLCAVIALAIVISCIGANVFAGTDKYNDYWCDGPFPETGVLFDWHFGQILPEMNSAATAAGVWYTDGPTAGTYASRWTSLMDKNVARVKPGVVMPEQGGAKAWEGATKIEDGRLSISEMFKVPSNMADLGKYTVYSAIWNDAVADYQGVLFNVNLDDPADPWLGFNTKFNHNAMTDRNPEVYEDIGEFYPIDCDKWYKAEAIIDYDNYTIDYYLDGEYKCSMTNSNLIDWYDLLWFDLKQINVWDDPNAAATATSGAEVHVAEVKLERLETKTEPKVVASGEKTLTIAYPYSFDADVDGSEFSFVGYTVESKAINANEITFTFGEAIDYTKPVMTTITKDVGFAGTSWKAVAGTTYAFAPQYAAEKNEVFLDQNFDNLTFPTNQTESLAFDTFYVQHHRAGVSHFNTEKKYTWDDVSEVKESGANAGSGKALALHRSRTDSSATYWGTDATVGLVIPFDGDKTITSGRFVIELDAARMPDDNKKINRDTFTVGLHDKNNEMTEYDKNTAWSNSTAFLQNGDYYETAQILFKPNGRSGGYSWYYQNLSNTPSKTGACLWPENADTAQMTVGDVYHYKIEADLSTGKYDLYKDGAKIGNQLDIPATDNDAEYDAFVVGMGFDPRDDAKTAGINRYVYIDNVKVMEPAAVAPLNLIDVRYGAKETIFGGTIVEDDDIKLNFSAPVSGVEEVDVNGTAIETYSISGNTITIPASELTDDGEITVTNVTSAGLTTYPSFTFEYEVVPPATATVNCYQVQSIKLGELKDTATMRFFFATSYDQGLANAYGAYIVPLSLFTSGSYDNTKLVKRNDTIDNGLTFSADLTEIPESAFDDDIAAIGFAKLEGKYFLTVAATEGEQNVNFCDVNKVVE